MRRVLGIYTTSRFGAVDFCSAVNLANKNNGGFFSSFFRFIGAKCFTLPRACSRNLREARAFVLVLSRLRPSLGKGFGRAPRRGTRRKLSPCVVVTRRRMTNYAYAWKRKFKAYKKAVFM